ncbi:MAG: helix-turn-helix transcriptional regulator [Halobacteriovoraceae bacterium]|nr:helix-turn-helix transcriptional regulator [Halobacteriovoraceae bacterium]
MSTKITVFDLIEEELGEITFGTFLRAARTSLGITQAEMGKKLRVSRSVICDIEKGRQLVSPELAIKIAKRAKLSEKLAVKLCLQDLLKKYNIKMKIKLVA